MYRRAWSCVNVTMTFKTMLCRHIYHYDQFIYRNGYIVKKIQPTLLLSDLHSLTPTRGDSRLPNTQIGHSSHHALIAALVNKITQSLDSGDMVI